MYFKASFSTVKKPPVTQLGGGKQEKAEMEFSTHAGVESDIVMHFQDFLTHNKSLLG